jgi:FMN phosphatase YigB (HAD superfamily)/DNA-binding XRE family transcriptional regulator
MVMDEKGLGKRIQKSRQKVGMTQQDLCHAANLSYSTLAKIERGAIKSPSIFTIQNIAAALKLTLDDLVGAAAPRKSTSKSGVSFVYFDVNGCLVRFYQRATARIAEDYGLQPDLVEMACLHFNDDLCRGALTMDEFNERLAQRLQITEVDWGKYYLEAAEPLQEMHDALAWASQHYRVGLLTNIAPGFLDKFLEAGKVPRLPYDTLVDSSKIGMVKPEAAIFEYAAAAAGLPPEQLLLVDDTLANLVAAEKQGWRVVWFDYARPEESAAHVREVLAL